MVILHCQMFFRNAFLNVLAVVIDHLQFKNFRKLGVAKELIWTQEAEKLATEANQNTLDREAL